MSLFLLGCHTKPRKTTMIGVPGNYQGYYDINQHYSAGQTVSTGKKYWTAIVDTQGETPGEGSSWMILSDVVGADVPTEGATYTDHDTVLAVQRALSAKGFDPGPFDGLMGPKTSTAIKKMQAALGADQTGVIDYGVLLALGIPVPSNAPSSLSSLPSSGRPAKGWSQPQPDKMGPAVTPDDSMTSGSVQPSFFMRETPLWGLKVWQAGLIGLGSLFVGIGALMALLPKRA